jgi:hypothetical protein
MRRGRGAVSPRVFLHVSQGGFEQRGAWIFILVDGRREQGRTLVSMGMATAKWSAFG